MKKYFPITVQCVDKSFNKLCFQREFIKARTQEQAEELALKIFQGRWGFYFEDFVLKRKTR